MAGVRVAVYAGTRNIYSLMYTALKSLIMNSDVDKVYMLIEDDEFPYELPDFVETMNVSDQTYFPDDGANTWKPWFTYMAYMRAVLAKLLPDLDVVLALDVDTIVQKDITDIWDLPIEDYYFSASREPVHCVDGKLYTNMGVTLYNLKKIREDHIDDAVVKIVNTEDLQCPEQMAFNRLCQGHILDMPSEYNCTRYTVETDDPKVIHYAGFKKWADFPEVKAFERIPMKEALKCRNDPSLRSTKAWKRGEKYMIHACPQRMWYVNDYLIPSLTEQGITKDFIHVWLDDKGMGNLESFMQSLKWIGENECYLDGTWHLQDDIVISKHFREVTQKETMCVTAGYCNHLCDGGNVNLVGLTPAHFQWLSMLCLRIPNYYAKECADWYYNDVLPNNKYSELVAEKKHDDIMWRNFMRERHSDEVVYNYIPNIVNHVDYMIGGSIANTHRKLIYTAYRWEEPEIVEALKERLENDRHIAER